MRVSGAVVLLVSSISCASGIPLLDRALALVPRGVHISWVTTTTTKHTDGRPDTVVKTVSSSPPSNPVSNPAPVTTTPATTGNGGAPTPVFKASSTPLILGLWEKGMTDWHNEYRRRHGAQPLTYNYTLAAYAFRNVAKCKFQHTDGPYGENIAAGYPDGPSVVKAWYDEYKDYNYQTTGYSEKTGHFSQVTWLQSSRLGCAKFPCPNLGIFVQCNYDPPGNYLGEFQSQVLPLQPGMVDT